MGQNFLQQSWIIVVYVLEVIAMLKKPQDIALLVFVRTPHQEVRYKRLLPSGSKHTNEQFFRQLNQHTIKIARQSNLPTFILDSPQQKGRTFGERLANAFQSIFSKGYQRVFAIGNDCLSLDTATIKDISQKLSSHSLVLGPTRDGGVYTIGLDKSAFNFDDFCQIPWQTSRVQEALAQYAKIHSHQPIEWLWHATDVDTFHSLFFLYKKGYFHPALQNPLKSLLNNLKKDHIISPSLRSSSTYFLATFHRGPPTLSPC